MIRWKKLIFLLWLVSSSILAGDLKKTLTGFEKDPASVSGLVQREIKNASSNWLALANVLGSIQNLNPIDAFQKSTELSQKARDIMQKDAKNQTLGFVVKPTLEYYKNMAPGQAAMTYLKNNPKALRSFARILYLHAQVFFLAKNRILLYEASSCYSLLMRELDTQPSQLQKWSNEIKMWNVELNKDVAAE